MVRRAGYTEHMGDEARDAFAGIYHKSFRPAGGPVLITSRPSETLHIPTCDGVAIIDRSVRPKVGDTIYFVAFGICQPGMLGRNYIACEDGETFEGEALEEITIIGVQTWGVISAREDNRPII